MELIKKGIITFCMFCAGLTFAQNNQNYAQLSTGYNRIGFFNEAAYKIGLNKHQLKLGVRHYTLDNFFEKNTLGFSFDYYYKLESQNKKYFFYPGVSTSFFVEKKTSARVFISDYKLINGIGVNLNSKWSLFYQLGVGVITTNSKVYTTNDLIGTAYFNYELAAGISFKFGKNKIEDTR